ncbi:hypothetical protein NQ314_018790 [Rhamnusium bicolor]|uniref:Reverse transcriptase domain-containing protein n=1 Tax=Rhamnusium bicolor TaxID=1586634 RepID=A0AAV8WQ99_9CUCU|nr:hypothetical protein NQ314_018790 [Rhamnusium bicolor]
MEKQILSKFQSGFREGFNCKGALQYFINEWKETKDNGRMTGVIFLDFKRAFKTIYRSMLLDQRSKYGMEMD